MPSPLEPMGRQQDFSCTAIGSECRLTDGPAPQDFMRRDIGCPGFYHTWSGARRHYEAMTQADRHYETMTRAEHTPTPRAQTR